MKNYFIVSKVMLFFALFALISAANGQGTRVSGKVTSNVDGSALPGVNVLVKNTSVGTVSDIDGNYLLEVSNMNATLVFSFIGFVSQEVPINGRSVINVILTEDVKSLQEVVVVGYTSKAQTQLSSSVSVVGEQELRDVTSPSLGDLLQGKAPGVMVSNHSGKPGTDPTVRIRGTGSLSASSDPLYVVDGVIGGTANPSDITSVTVLKDAAATGLYGSRAANGVIVITTKSGKAGKTKVNFSSSAGFNNATFGHFEQMNSQETYDYNYPMYVDDYTGKRNNFIAQLQATNPNPTEAEIAAYLTSRNLPTTLDAYINLNLPPSLKETDINWRDLAFRTGITHNYELSTSGGNEKTQFYIAGNYYNEEGTVSITDYERYNIRLNLSHKINDRFSITGRVNGRMDYTTDDPPMARSTIHQSTRNSIWDNPYNEDGSIKTGLEAGWRGREPVNFLYELQYNYSTGRSNSVQGDLVLDYEINDWLSFSTTNRSDLYNSRAESYADPLTSVGSGRQGLLTNNILYRQSLLNSNLLKASKIFNLHTVNGILGAEFQTNYGDFTNSSGGGVPSGLAIMNVSAVPVGITGSKYRSAFNSYFSQLDYSYDNRYFGVASFRRDGSSKFGANNLYGNFFALGGSWIVSNERFMPQSGPLSLLKFRASYGTTGNANIEDFISLALYSFNVQYAGLSGAIPSRLANPDLTWEKAYTTNIGFDVGVFERFTLSIDAYQRDNDNLLFDVPLSAASGFNSQIQNIGKMRNKGIEFDLHSVNVSTDDLRWESNLNIGFNKNRVMELYNGQPIESGHQRVMEGHTLYTWYMQKWAGVDPETGGPLWEKLTYDADGNVTNVETTSNYNEATRQIVGKADPDFTGGFYNMLSYKGLSLHVFLNFVQGMQVYHDTRESFDSDGATPQNTPMRLRSGWSRWTAPGDLATHPYPVLGGGGRNSHRPSSRYLEDGSYIRLRNVRLNYEIPASWLQRLNMGGLNIFISGDNLITWTKFSGMDPEVDFSRAMSDNKYPISKKVLFGFNLGL